ncbi:release factor glutamine methyltransferase [Desulfuromonas versatilis]|uniref:Release factor glutamine methyltransferase n=1 Tax=Desulfuromonas versatilis TaxID=2802975 RepID=A0ABN6E6P2_9BACT|nr:peptide chain release factor N(5)-glutamine methyltransferase [Desulfuromonas versatilis]BCR06506.1 release factor glutamine methyltransferase [Desulfuromonas versatilis]
MAERWTVLKILQWTAGYFRERGIEEGRRDAEIMLADLLGLDRVGLYLNYDKPLTPDEQAAFRALVGRRARREPVQYILGHTEFWSLPLQVTPAVLIPRPDTEVLVEEGLKRVSGACRILDIGLGSGAVAIALAHELAEAQVEGIDLSAAALQVALGNAERNGVAARVDFRQADLASFQGGPYDLVVSNPPYIPEGDLAGLMPEVKDFEPRLALAGGADGLDCYRILAARVPAMLRQGGWLLVEVGIDQAESVQRLFAAAGLSEICCRDDYAGVPRVVGGRKAAVS